MVLIPTLLTVTITTFLVILLARTLWHKTDRFLETVGFAQGYGLIADRWTASAVRALAVAEGMTLLALLLPGLHRFGGAMAAALFAGYGLLMALALMKGRTRIECGCGGAPQIVSAYTLSRHAVLAALALALIFLPVQPLGYAEAAFAIAAAMVLSVIFATIETLASHLPHIREGNLK